MAKPRLNPSKALTPPQPGGCDASIQVSVQIEHLELPKLGELLRYVAFKFVAHQIKP